MAYELSSMLLRTPIYPTKAKGPSTDFRPRHAGAASTDFVVPPRSAWQRTMIRLKPSPEVPWLLEETVSRHLG